MHRIFTRLSLLTLLLPLSCFGQIAYQATPNPHPVFFGINGLALAGGQVCTYASGTTTPLATYKDNLGTANSPCITLDAGGSAYIYLGQSAYRFITFNSFGVQQYLYDPVSNFTQFLLSTQNAWTQPQQFQGGTSDPSGVAGLLWYRTDLAQFRFFNSAWDSLVGRVTTDTLSNKTLAGTVPYNRLRANQGSALVIGDVALSGNWGTGAALNTPSGTDSAGTISVVSGTTAGANPVVTLTFHDGTWTSAPLCVVSQSGLFADGNHIWTASSVTATQLQITLIGTPANSTSYPVNFICVGRP